jgi:hypothetical protein
MSNTSKGLAEKGSKFWMQAIVNSKMIDQLNAEIGVPLDWLSPLKGEKEEYLEYELKQGYFHFGPIDSHNGMVLRYQKIKRYYILWKQKHI